MKTKLILICFTLCLVLSGCTVEADRIYTVCKETPEVLCFYNASGVFYKKDKNTQSISKVEPIGLTAKPILLLDIKEGNYALIEDVPNKYICTLDDFNNYLNCLIVNDNASYDLSYVDYKSVELTVCCDTYSLKCFYTNNDFLRLYCIDSDGNPITPPYINEGE